MTENQLTHARVSTGTQIRTITKYNFLNYFRARRFYVMLSIIVIISGLITALVAYYRPPIFLGSGALGFYGAGWGGFANFVIVLSAAFFGGDAISGEFQNRTGYFLVPNPIRRSAIYTGKYLAALAASSIILGIFALVMVANGLYYFPGSIPWEFVESVIFAWVYLIAVLSLTFAFSSLFKSSAISILMSVILLLFVFNVVDEVSEFVAGIEPWYSITYGAGIVSNVMGGGLARGLAIIPFTPTIPEGLAILLSYFVAMGIVGLWLFQRKEFTS